jgi:hypothetical protein
MEFYQTVGGRCFYEKTMPELNKNIEKLSQQLSEMNQNIIQKEAEVAKASNAMTLETKAVVISDNENIVDVINNCEDGWYFKELLRSQICPYKELINPVIILERVKPIEDNKDNELSITEFGIKRLLDSLPEEYKYSKENEDIIVEFLTDINIQKDFSVDNIINLLTGFPSIDIYQKGENYNVEWDDIQPGCCLVFDSQGYYKTKDGKHLVTQDLYYY